MEMAEQRKWHRIISKVRKWMGDYRNQSVMEREAPVRQIKQVSI